MDLADLPYTELDLFDGAGMTAAELRELDAKMWRAQRRVQSWALSNPATDGMVADLAFVRRAANRAFFAQWGR